MRKILSTITQNGIFTSLFAGTTTFVLCYAILDHWAFDGSYARSIDKGIALLPILFVFTVIVGSLVEFTGLMYRSASSHSPTTGFFNFPSVILGIYGGLLTGLAVGSTAIFIQVFLSNMFGLRILWH